MDSEKEKALLSVLDNIDNDQIDARNEQHDDECKPDECEETPEDYDDEGETEECDEGKTEEIWLQEDGCAPIFLSTTKVTGRGVWMLMRMELTKLVDDGTICDTSKVLLLSGTDCKSWTTALSEENLHKRRFYKEDCRAIGIKPTKSIDDVCKLDEPPIDSLYADESYSRMEIQ